MRIRGLTWPESLEPIWPLMKDLRPRGGATFGLMLFKTVWAVMEFTHVINMPNIAMAAAQAQHAGDEAAEEAADHGQEHIAHVQLVGGDLALAIHRAPALHPALALPPLGLSPFAPDDPAYGPEAGEKEEDACASTWASW